MALVAEGSRGANPGAADRGGLDMSGSVPADGVAATLEYLRGELRAERISYGELAELQGLADQIDPSDVELLEAAGVPEFPEVRDRFERLLEVVEDDELAVVERVARRAGLLWDCYGGDDSPFVCWTNREEDLTCCNCGRKREVAS